MFNYPFSLVYQFACFCDWENSFSSCCLLHVNLILLPFEMDYFFLLGDPSTRLIVQKFAKNGNSLKFNS